MVRAEGRGREGAEGGRRSSLDPPQVVPGSPGFRGLLWIPGYKAVFSGSPAVCGPKSAFPGSRFRKGVFSGSPYQKRPSLAPEFQDRTSGVGRDITHTPWQCCLRGRLRSRCGRRWRGRRRPLHACLRRFRAGDFAAGADSDDESAQQVWMEMARHANCNPKSRTLNPSSMMQADSSATLSKPVVSSTHLRRFREPDPKNSVAFACCDPRCPRSRTMRHVTLKA